LGHGSILAAQNFVQVKKHACAKKESGYSRRKITSDVKSYEHKRAKNRVKVKQCFGSAHHSHPCFCVPKIVNS
jgi:hypothetical protein